MWGVGVGGGNEVYPREYVRSGVLFLLFSTYFIEV